MVKRQKKGITKKDTGKGFNERSQEARKIGASTIYDWLAAHRPAVALPKLKSWYLYQAVKNDSINFATSFLPLYIPKCPSHSMSASSDRSSLRDFK